MKIMTNDKAIIENMRETDEKQIMMRMIERDEKIIKKIMTMMKMMKHNGQ